MELDLIGINTYGFNLIQGENSWVDIDLPHCIVTITRRPFYCDRGRYGFIVEVKPEHRDKMNIDWADGFPRYFFSLQRAFDEMNDWVEFRKLDIGITK